MVEGEPTGQEQESQEPTAEELREAVEQCFTPEYFPDLDEVVLGEMKETMINIIEQHAGEEIGLILGYAETELEYYQTEHSRPRQYIERFEQFLKEKGLFEG